MPILINILNSRLTTEELESLKYVSEHLSNCLMNHSTRKDLRAKVQVKARQARSNELFTCHAMLVMSASASKTATEEIRVQLVSALGEYLNRIFPGRSICIHLTFDQVGDTQPRLMGRNVMRNLRLPVMLERLVHELQNYRFVNELVREEA